VGEAYNKRFVPVAPRPHRLGVMRPKMRDVLGFVLGFAILCPFAHAVAFVLIAPIAQWHVGRADPERGALIPAFGYAV
jgi:hypothetical protein